MENKETQKTEQVSEHKKGYRLFRIIRWLAWLIFPKFTVEGLENLPEHASVIVGNHSQMYGPVFGELYFPGKHKIWCVGKMMNAKEVPEYAYTDFWWNKKPLYIRWFYKFLSYFIAPISQAVFTNAQTIAVYRDNRLVSTFRDTVKCLQDGNNVIIYPEHYVDYNHILCDFEDRFVDTARFYYRKTGEALDFVPLYLAPRLKKAYIGKPVRFDPNAPIAEERARICDYLKEEITSMAVSLPEHTVVPYRNISKKLYGTNIPPKEQA